MFDEASSSEERSRSGGNKESDNRLARDEIREMGLERDTEKAKKQKLCVKGAACDGKECLLNVRCKIALFLCYVCNLFLCENCLRVHDKTHEFVRLESEESERRRKGHLLIGRMRSERMKEFNFHKEDTNVYSRINVKHELDQADCRITGLCGLQDKRWVILDSHNTCIKMLSSVTNKLLRYVRFGSQPYDVTEIKQALADPNPASGSKSGVSASARDEQGKQCFLAVTFARIKQIWFVDVNKTPAVKTKSINIQKYCWQIDFSENNIFSLCSEGVGSDPHNSVVILSAGGNPLKVIQFQFYPRDLAVYNDKIYITNYNNRAVICINVENGKTISQLNIEGSRPEGICVDDCNNVYVCGWDNNKVYKLFSDLRGIEQVSLDTGYTTDLDRICFTNNKLFIGHWSLFLNNFITVVQLT